MEGCRTKLLFKSTSTTHFEIELPAQGANAIFDKAISMEFPSALELFFKLFSYFYHTRLKEKVKVKAIFDLKDKKAKFLQASTIDNTILIGIPTYPAEIPSIFKQNYIDWEPLLEKLAFLFIKNLNLHIKFKNSSILYNLIDRIGFHWFFLLIERGEIQNIPPIIWESIISTLYQMRRRIQINLLAYEKNKEEDKFDKIILNRDSMSKDIISGILVDLSKPDNFKIYPRFYYHLLKYPKEVEDEREGLKLFIQALQFALNKKIDSYFKKKNYKFPI